MSAFDWGSYDYKTEGGDFMSETEVQMLIGMGTIVAITGIREDDANTWNNKPKPRWLVDVFYADPATGEDQEKTRGFSKGVEARDDRLRRLKATIEETGEPISARFTKIGQAYDVTGA